MEHRIFSVLRAPCSQLKSAARLAAQWEKTDTGRLDIRPCRQVIIDDLADRGKARDSKSNRRKCNPKAECRLYGGPNRPWEADIPACRESSA